MNNLLSKSKLFLKKNTSTILTCAGAAGVIATTVMAVQATPKALTLIKEEEAIKGGDLTKLEKVKVAGPTYIPAAITGVATIACIFGANVLNKRYQASLISAYALLDTSFKDYKRKLKELYGQETHNNIIDSLTIEKAENVNVTGAYFSMDCDLSIEDNDGSEKLFYDEFSNRYFEATIEQVISAEYHLNRNYTLRGYSVLNELYEFLGLETTDNGSVLGWMPTDEGEYWIDFNHRKVVMDDGLECYIIEMPFEPKPDFNEWY